VRLDPADRRPPYRQVADQLRQAITSGAYAPGERLPSRRQLAREYGIAPMTLGSALNVLREEGLVAIAHGSGVYVQEPSERPETSAPDSRRVAELEADVSELRHHVAALREQVADIYARIGAPLPRTDDRARRSDRA
jgi:GntR family transcriptional regulator